MSLRSTLAGKTALLPAAPALAMMVVGAASAQDSGQSVPATRVPLQTVVVTGFRESLAKDLQIKRTAVGVVDAIEAEDIGKFPDLNVSESLQRITGVTIYRTVTGEGDTVSLRGLPPEFTRVTLNGMTATSGNTGRQFDFDVFASDLFSGAKVYKTPSAEMTEGGLAGTINLRTPEPFDYQQNQRLLSVGGQYAQLGRGEVTPRISGLASWRSSGGKFGLLGSVSYSKSDIRNDTRQGFRYQLLSSATGLVNLVKQQSASGGPMPTVDLNGNDISDPNQLLSLANSVAFPMLPRVGVDILDLKRLGITGAIQFRPSSAVLLSTNALYAEYDQQEERHTIDAALGFSGTAATNAIPLSLTTVQSGVVDYAVKGTFDGISQRSESVDDLTKTRLLQITSDGTYVLTDRLTASSALGYSRTDENDLYRDYLYNHVGEVSYDLTDPTWPKFSGVDFNYLDPSEYAPNQLRLRPGRIFDTAYRERFDLDWRAGSVLTHIKAGIEGSQRRKENAAQSNLTLNSTGVPFAQVSFPIESIVNNYDSGAPAGVPGNFLGVNVDRGRSLLLPDSMAATDPADLAGSWIVSERVMSGYVQSDWAFDFLGRPLTANLGARIAHTDQTSRGSEKFGNTFEPISIHNTYTDVLPSLNVRWSLMDDLVARFSANKAITRPTLSDLSAGITIGSTNNLTASAGNPQLKPFRATQFDVGLEWYFRPQSLISVDGFYKDMKSFIVSSQEERVITGENLINDAGQDVSGETFTVTLPINGTGGKLYGMELGYQQPFTFLPGLLNGFGVVTNMTLTHSSGQIVQGGITTTQALQGQADLSYNIIGYYEKGPISIRAAFTYRGSYIDQFRSDLWPSGVPHSLYYAPRRQLDLAARYEVNEIFQLYADAINVTNTDHYSYDTIPGMSRDYFAQGAVYNFGVRAKF